MTQNSEQALANLRLACARLAEAVDALERGQGELQDLVRDAAIQRFEFTFELAWKLLAKLLSEAGQAPAGPRPTLRRAYAAGWIDDEAAWLAMLEDRNATTHVYDESVAAQLATHLPGHLAALQDLVSRAPGFATGR